MAEIQTVRGPVDTADLGVTLMHEHIFVLTPDVQTNYPGEWGDEDTRVAQAVERLRTAYDAGVRTIVDPTVVGLGRYVPRIQRIMEQVPIQLVVATGVYTYNDAPRFFTYVGPALNEVLGTDEDQIDTMLVDVPRQFFEGAAG